MIGNEKDVDVLDELLKKFQIYNSLFLNLSYQENNPIGHLLPLLTRFAKKRMDEGQSPLEILDAFMLAHRDLIGDDKINFLFKVIQYVERQVVLFDSVEDVISPASLEDKQIIHVKDLVQSANNQETIDNLIDKLNDFQVRIVLTAHPTQFYRPPVLNIIAKLRDEIKANQIENIDKLLHQLGLTTLVNSKSPTPLDEARNIIHICRHYYYDAIGDLYTELEKIHPNIANPEILTLGFWPCGDRDGNQSSKPMINTEVTKIGSLTRLAQLDFKLSEASTKCNTTPTFAATSIVPIQKKNAYINFAISKVLWQDKLNSNYLGALSPADFTQNAERGHELNLSYHQHISHPLAIGFQVAYSDINIKSGHNTTLNYDVNTESNGTQSFNNLRLATPYGFVQSDLVVSRASFNTDEERSLDASINSKHQLKILSLAPSLDLHLLKRNKFKLVVNINAGLNYMLSLINEIDFLDTGHADYALQTGIITEEQSNVNTTFWSAGFGIRSQYTLSSRISIGARFAFSGGLTPLYQMDDFSGRASATQIGLNTSFKF